MDSEKIIQDLNRRFAAPLPEFYRRRIIVWYDEEGEFKDRLNELSLDNAKVVALTGSNYFAVRKLISVEDTRSNILLYCPLSYNRPDDNWLLDVELYSEEFRADLIAMWMDEMHLESTTAMRQQVKAFRKYFNAKPRRERIARMKQAPSSPARLNIAVMSAIAGLSEGQPSEIIQKVLCGGLEEQSNHVYQELVNFGADKPFWEMASQGTGYTVQDNEKKSLEGLFTHILLLALSCNYVCDVPKNWDVSGMDKQRGFCFDLVSNWLRSDEVESYVKSAKTIEEKLHAREYFMKQQIDDLLPVEEFPCINEILLQKLMSAISNEIIDIDKIRKVVEKRRVSALYSDYAPIFEGLRQFANMQEFYLNHSQGFHLATTKEIWKAYTSDYYKMDQYYRLLHEEYEQYLLHFDPALNDLYSSVIDQAEKLYNTTFLDGLGSNWTSICEEELAKNGHIWDVPRQVDFYKNFVRKAENRIFVVISDSMRYEVAAQLGDELAVRQQSKVKMSSQQAMFPTITKFGMAALLPHRNLSLDVQANNIKVLADGVSTDSPNREVVLKSANPDSCVLKYSDIIAMKSAERSDLVKGMKVVYIYHDTIDDASHKSDTEVFDACSKAIDQLKNLVDIMVKDFKALHILITSDHGFLYTYSPLQETAKLETSDFRKRIVEYGRRFVMMTKGEAPDYLLPVKLQAENSVVDAYAPKENVRLKSSGGMKYVHGGASLQELVVPVIDYQFFNASTKEYQKNKEKLDSRPVGVSLLTANHLISNRAFSLEFYQNEPVGSTRSRAEYYTYLIDEFGNKVSDMPMIIADHTGDNAQERIFRVSFNLKAIDFKPNKSYYLIIADEEGMEVSRQEFEIAVVSSVKDMNRADPNKLDYFS